MANSMIKIDVHLIFHIKSTSVQMQQCDLPQIFSYIGGILKDIGSIPIIVGGIPDHIHTLVALPSNMTISELVRTTKNKKQQMDKNFVPILFHVCMAGRIWRVLCQSIHS